MNKLKLTGFMSAILLMLTISSCKKDKYGNTNITSSNTITATNWISESDDGTNYVFKSANSWDVITQDIVDNGVVLGYYKQGSEWLALPYSEDGDTYSLNFNFSFEVGKIYIYADGWENPISPNPSDFNGLVFRFVAISEHQRMANPNVDLTNYEEVKRVFEIKD